MDVTSAGILNLVHKYIISFKLLNILVLTCMLKKNYIIFNECLRHLIERPKKINAFTKRITQVNICAANTKYYTI